MWERGVGTEWSISQALWWDGWMDVPVLHGPPVTILALLPIQLTHKHSFVHSSMSFIQRQIISEIRQIDSMANVYNTYISYVGCIATVPLIGSFGSKTAPGGLGACLPRTRTGLAEGKEGDVTVSWSEGNNRSIDRYITRDVVVTWAGGGNEGAPMDREVPWLEEVLEAPPWKNAWPAGITNLPPRPSARPPRPSHGARPSRPPRLPPRNSPRSLRVDPDRSLLRELTYL